MPQVVRSPKPYDVCIIGSGAGGGTAAKILTEGGLNVVMLEAGPPLNPEKDYKEHLGLTICRTVALALAASFAAKSTTNLLRRTAHGRSMANLTPRRRDRAFAGFGLASSVAAPITGDASRCDLLL